MQDVMQLNTTEREQRMRNYLDVYAQGCSYFAIVKLILDKFDVPAALAGTYARRWMTYRI